MNIQEKVENLLSTGYTDLEFDYVEERDSDVLVYRYFGYTDDYMVINVYVNADYGYVEVQDCYADEESYSQFVKLTYNEFIKKY